MDQIKIKGLEVYANHGVYDEEQKLGQKFLVNVGMSFDTSVAGLSDDLGASVNYGEVCHEITRFMKAKSYKLIEAVAEHLAADLFMHYEPIRALDVEIIKPWAPIGLPVEQVSVAINRKWHRAIISFGSNMGERPSHIKNGIEALKKIKACRVLKVSDISVSKPYGGIAQDDFLNGCMEIETLFTPGDLLMVLNSIEEQEGRERLIHWGPRTLDLDIITYDEEIIDNKELRIPHQDMQNRDFVLKPMMQLTPYWKHPILGKTVTQLYKELTDDH